MPKAEVIGCLEAETDGFSVTDSGPGYVIASFNGEFFGRAAERLALSHCAGRYLGEYISGEISGFDETMLPAGTFAVKGKRFEGMMADADSQGMIRRIGGMLSKYNDVDLKNPDFTVKMHMSDRVHLFIEDHTTEKNLLEKRKVSERPFFSPISLHPKYARALINMTGVRTGGRVLDPFCGTGGIAIEAASMGMKALVSDFDEEMIAGCRENMDFYGYSLEDFEVTDVSGIAGRFEDIDAVCTDPPYGRSTKTGGENIRDIYRKASEAVPEVLKPGARAGIVLPYPASFDTMKLEGMYVQRVHGSLSRHYHIFRNV